MKKTKLRKITIDNEVFLWKREHLHLTEFNYSKCVEKIVVYLENYKNAPLKLFFREEDNLILKKDIENERWCVGYPDSGVIWLFKAITLTENDSNALLKQLETIDINLNRPAVITELIKYFLQNDWKPKENKKPHIVEDALKLLDSIMLPKETIMSDIKLRCINMYTKDEQESEKLKQLIETVKIA